MSRKRRAAASAPTAPSERKSYALSQAKQRAVVALVRQRDEVIREADKEIAAINAAIGELVEMIVAQAGLEGEWELHQDTPGGPILLRKKEEPPTPAPEPESKSEEVENE